MIGWAFCTDVSGEKTMPDISFTGIGLVLGMLIGGVLGYFVSNLTIGVVGGLGAGLAIGFALDALRAGRRKGD